MNFFTYLRKVSQATVLFLALGAAFAAPIQHTYSFQASGFEAGAPVDPIFGSITATFDQSAIGSGTVDAISLNIGTHIFSANEVGFEGTGDGIIFGGFSCAVTCISNSTNDFWLYWTDFSDLNGGQFVYSNNPQGSLAFFYASSITVTEGGTIPEPGVVSLFALGVLGIAALRLRKQ